MTVLENGTDNISVMDDYVSDTAKLKVQGGVNTVEVTLTNSDWIKELKTERAGTLTDVTNITQDTYDNATSTYKRVVQFAVADLTAKLNASVHVVIPVMSYDESYDVQFKFNATNVPLAQTSLFPDNAQPIGLSIYKDGTTEPSSMGNYVSKPGTLYSDETGYYVAFTLSSSNLITTLTYDVEGGATEAAKVLSEDTAAKKRVVALRVTDLTKKLNVHMTVQAGPTLMTHTVQFAFDLNGVVFKLPYTVYKDGTEQASSMETYVSKPASLKVQNGYYALSFTLSRSDLVKTLQYDKAGTKTDATELSADADAKTRLLEIQTTDLSVRQNVYLSVQAGPTLMTHTVQYGYQAAGLPLPVKAPGSGTTPTDPTDPTNPSNPGNEGPKLSDGYYTLNYRVLKSGTTQPSVMEDYIQHPGWLQVSGSQKYAYIILNKGKEITSLSVGGSSVATIKNDQVANKRLVRFEVTGEIPVVLSGSVRVDWDEVNYHNTYPIDIEIQSVGGATADPRGQLQDTTTGAPQGSGPATDEGSGTKPEDGSSVPSTPEPAVKLSDIAAHWASASIEKAVELGFVTGYKDGSFRPNAEVNRAEIAVMLAKALKLTPSTGAVAFKDDGSIPAYAKDYVALAAGNGILQGYADQTFRASERVSRAQMAVMVVRALGLPVDESAELSFADAAAVPAWAKPYVAAAVKAGLLEGRTGNQFAPNGNTTRAEAVTLILRLLSLNGEAQS
ncbi:NEAT domain-containing protein [Cohnella sp. GCM10020058]|uniref:NEAT domain-containing protein n=1 Tax=Cohnella sp. GCM10020058 TaxID=3317330 RepID=UPI003645870A